MLNRRSFTLAGAVTASLISGAVAVGATVGHTAFTSLVAADAAPTSSPAAAEVPADAGLPPGDAFTIDRSSATVGVKPSPAAKLWLAALAANGNSSAAPTWTPAPASASGSSTETTGKKAPAAKPSSPTTTPNSPTAAPSPSPPPPTAAPTTATTTPLYNCSGSDDGLSEVDKHAREEWCHAHGGSRG
ncbi:MAG: hypothetical protein JJE46_03455 [Acidimicrobiia bacterium]|nr:hypothetical protein [Acidimicrobiia bacterium]